MSDVLQPPWIAHPDIPRGSIGWRMGRGEEFYDKFYKWFSGLSPTEQASFAKENPEPSDWAGFYETLISHPWLT